MQLRLGVAVLAATALVVAVLSTDVFSRGSTDDMAATAPAGMSAALDGLSFVGQLRSADGRVAIDDQMHFVDGHFWSSGCTKCSFLPGAYWTRSSGGALDFRGDLQSIERGRFSYAGRFEDDELSAQIHWKRARWYWTVERDYVFEGRLQKEVDGGVTLQSAWQRALGLAASTCPI